MGTTPSGFIYPDSGYTSGWRQAIEDLADSAEDVILEAGVPRFADAAARDAAIPSPVLGMRAVLTSDQIRYRYNGSTWAVDVGYERHQADTTNSTRGTLPQTGIGKVIGSGTSSVSEAVTFPTAFGAVGTYGPPVVLVVGIGSRATGAYNPTGLSASQSVQGSAMSVTATGFTAYLYQTTGGTLSAANDWYYNWVAYGVPA